MTVGDRWLLSYESLTEKLPLMGIEQVAGATPEINWANGLRLTYQSTEGLRRVDAANISDLVNWINRRVDWVAANYGLRARGVVVEVLVFDPAGTPTLGVIMKRDKDGLFQVIESVKNVTIVPNS